MYCIIYIFYKCNQSAPIKKGNEISLIYEEIQTGSVAKSYMRKGFVIFEKMRK